MTESLDKFNKILDKYMWVIPPVSIILGILAGDTLSRLTFLSVYIFAIMTFTSSISMKARDFVRVFRHPLPLLSFFLAEHVIIPLIGFFLARLIFNDNPMVVLGFVLLWAGPVAVVIQMWTSAHDGDAPLAVSLIMLDTVLSPLVMPFTVSVFYSESVEIDTSGMMLSLLWMVVIPLVLAVLINELTRGRAGTATKPWFRVIGKAALFGALFLNASKVSNEFKSLTWSDFDMVLFCIFFTMGTYILGYGMSRMFHFNEQQSRTLIFAAGLRNTTASLTVAVSFFSRTTGIPIILSIAFQQVICAFTSRFILHLEKPAANANS